MSRPKPSTTKRDHLNANAGDAKRMCGGKDLYPVTWVRWAERLKPSEDHCIECYTAAGLESLLLAPQILALEATMEEGTQ